MNGIYFSVHFTCIGVDVPLKIWKEVQPNLTISQSSQENEIRYRESSAIWRLIWMEQF